VDQSGNLRAEDGTLIPVSPELVSAILDKNPHRRARRTAAGHLIVRVDSRGSDEADWRFLGSISLPEEGSGEIPVTILRIRTSSGRRVIALEEGPKNGVRFALGPEASIAVERGQARDRLLEWVRSQESERGVPVREVFWDNESRYWIEVSGDRITYEGPLAPLEFKT
jgi:hypothetical protein